MEKRRSISIGAYRMKKDGIRQIKEEYERLRDEMKGHLNYERSRLREYSNRVGAANFRASATWDMDKYMHESVSARHAYKKQKELVEAMERQYKAKLNLARANIEKYRDEIRNDPFGVYKPNMSQKERLSVLERRLY